MAATTSAARRGLTGTPDVPSPRISQIGRVGRGGRHLDCVLQAEDRRWPRTKIKVTSVVRKARSRKYPTNKPLTSPTNPPRRSRPTMTSYKRPTGDIDERNEPVKLQSAKFEPTLRSMPPASITTVIPSAGNQLLAKLPTSRPSCEARKTGESSLQRKATTTISINTGMALSIQSLERSSPTTMIRYQPIPPTDISF